jgi:hypothetical protein
MAKRKRRITSRRTLAILLVLLIATIAIGDALMRYYRFTPTPVVVHDLTVTNHGSTSAGVILSQTAPVTYTVDQVQAISHADYG